MLKEFVLDASITLSWAFPNELSSAATIAGALLEDHFGHALVTVLWWFEVRNGLIANERRGRINETGTARFLNALRGLSITLVPERDEQGLLRLARSYRLTAYDAAYIAVAKARNIPLATLDRALAEAAKAEGIALVGA